MSATTGPVLAIGAVTMFNQVILNDRPIDWRVPIATAITAGGFALFERALPRAAVALAWTALVAVLFTRVDPSVPAPAESALAWWEKGK